MLEQIIRLFKNAVLFENWILLNMFETFLLVYNLNSIVIFKLKQNTFFNKIINILLCCYQLVSEFKNWGRKVVIFGPRVGGG